jgi:hypothetical protein
VHEAGHAIGRILGADAHSIPVDDMVTSIVIGVGIATTYGPTFPRAVQDALQKHIKVAAARGESEIAPVFAIMEIENARAQGVDVDGWLWARLIMIALGPCAEAKVTGRDPFEVFHSEESRGDRRDAMTTCNYASTGAERGAELIAGAIEAAAALLERPNLWRAVLTVADLIPARGTLPGDKIIRAVSR